MRPIAGTRKRGRDATEDAALAKELLSDEKEIAEHLMLIDLGRNDVGQIAEAGSVELTERMVIERYSHVMHMVSNVSATVREDVGPMEALRAALPAGTLSGAPKVRAMEIIDELERPSEAYTAGQSAISLGPARWTRNRHSNCRRLRWGRQYSSGAGIVADSVPTLEWEETLNKARAMLRAISMCQWRATLCPFGYGPRRGRRRRVYFLSMWLISKD